MDPYPCHLWGFLFLRLHIQLHFRTVPQLQDENVLTLHLSGVMILQYAHN